MEINVIYIKNYFIFIVFLILTGNYRHVKTKVTTVFKFKIAQPIIDNRLQGRPGRHGRQADMGISK